MSGEPPRFTSDRRRRAAASWTTNDDWAVGTVESVDVVGGDLVAHDGEEGGVPDGGLLHCYNFPEADSTTSLSDLAGGNDLVDGSFTDLDGSINGLQAGTFDGYGDGIGGSFSSPISQPYHIFSVSESAVNDGRGQTVHDARGNNAIAARRFDNGVNGEYQWNAGSQTDGGTPTTDPEILEAVADGAGSELVSNGSVVSSGNAGGDALDGLTIGNTDPTSAYNPHNGVIGEILIYDPTAIGYSRTKVRSYLANKWSIKL